MIKLNISPLKQQYGNSCVIACARMIHGFYNPNLMEMINKDGAEWFYASALLGKIKDKGFMTDYFAKKSSNKELYNYFANSLKYISKKSMNELSVDEYVNMAKGEYELEILLQQILGNSEIIVGNTKSFEDCKNAGNYFENYIFAVKATREEQKKVCPAIIDTYYYGLPHAMVFAGINEKNIICNDPYSGKEINIPILDIIEKKMGITPIYHKNLIY